MGGKVGKNDYPQLSIVFIEAPWANLGKKQLGDMNILNFPQYSLNHNGTGKNIASDNWNILEYTERNPQVYVINLSLRCKTYSVEEGKSTAVRHIL